MGQSSTTNSNQTVAPYGVQGSSLDILFPAADRAFRQSRAVPAYTGDFVAQANDTQRAQTANGVNFTAGAGQDAVSGLFSNGYQSANAGLGGATGAMNGLSNFANTNQAAQTLANAQLFGNKDLVNAQALAAMDSATKALNEQTLPGIDVSAAMTGNNLGTRTGIATGIVDRDYRNQFANVAANLGANDYNQGLTQAANLNQQQLSALSGAGSLGNSLLSAGQYGLNSGITGNATNQAALQTGINAQLGYDQAGLTNSLDQNSYRESQPFQAVNQYNNVVNTRNIGSNTTGTSTTQTDPGIGSILGSGLGAIGGLKCDARCKTNIREVGKLYNGLPVYSFEYIGNPNVTHIGPMAQDVQARNVDAVFDIDGVTHIRGDFLERI